MTTHSSAPTRLGARALRGALAVFVTLAAVFAAAPAAAHAPGTTNTTTSPRAAASPSPAPDGEDDPGTDTTPTLVVAPSGDGVITGTQAFTLSARATNTAAGDAVFTTSDAPLTTAEAVAAWLGHEDAATPTPITLATAMLTSTTGDAVREHVGSVAVDPAAAGIDRLGRGVYPLLATFTASTGTLTARSVLVVGDTTATGPVAAIVPITAPPPQRHCSPRRSSHS